MLEVDRPRGGNRRSGLRRADRGQQCAHATKARMKLCTRLRIESLYSCFTASTLLVLFVVALLLQA